MRRVREILRLKWELGLSARQVARSCGLTHPTVLNYVRRAEACGLSWPLPASLGDETLERRLFPLIPFESCHPFQAKPATDSRAKLPPWQPAGRAAYV